MGLWPLVSSGYGKPMFAKVATMDADLDRIAIESDWRGRNLFDTVCRIIGLREIWFFGLQYVNKKGFPCWLQMDKKIATQDVSKTADHTLEFLFIVKFYPEDVENELIQDLTRHLFFVQLKEAILSGELLCSAEASVLLASYALQAIYGDCSEEQELELERLIPKGVLMQYDMDKEQWVERIKRWWLHNQGQAREDAEMEYLRVAQDLEMYAIQYYPIRNKKESDLLLGVSPTGVGVYKKDDRVTPRPFFAWNEIKNVHFKNKKFFMKTVDKSEISFQAMDASINRSIMDLCVGTHNLYLRRRSPDLLEVQQMRAQAQEQRIRRMQEQELLRNERDSRLAAEEEKKRLAEELQEKEEQLHSLAEQARAAESRMGALSKRASEAEAECARAKQSQNNLEEANLRMERKAQEMEVYTRRLATSLHDSRKPLYASHAFLPHPTWSGQLPLPLQGTLSYHQLMMSSSSHGDEINVGGGDVNGNQLNSGAQTLPALNGSSSSSTSALLGVSPLVLSAQGVPPQLFMPLAMQAPPPDPSQYGVPPDLMSIKEQLESTRKQYNERSRSFKEKLAEFRVEIENLKKDEPPLEEVMPTGQFDRLTTLRMSQKGTPNSRVRQMDQL